MHYCVQYSSLDVMSEEYCTVVLLQLQPIY